MSTYEVIAEVINIHSSTMNIDETYLKGPKVSSEVMYETYSGAFYTSFFIPMHHLNDQLTKKLRFEYSSHEKDNRGLGVGFKLGLPKIVKSQLQLRSQYTLIRNGKYVELVKNGDFLVELNLTFFGEYKIEEKFIHATFPDGKIEIYDILTGSLIEEISKFSSAGIKYVWEHLLLKKINVYNGLELNFRYAKCDVAQYEKYKNLEKKQVIDGLFHSSNDCLQSITYNKEEKIQFKYSGPFLENAFWEKNDDRFLFLADYSNKYKVDNSKKDLKIHGTPSDSSMVLNLGEEGVRFVDTSKFYERFGLVQGNQIIKANVNAKVGMIQTADFNNDGLTDLIISSHIHTAAINDNVVTPFGEKWHGTKPKWRAPQFHLYIGHLSKDRKDLEFSVSPDFVIPMNLVNTMPVCSSWETGGFKYSAPESYANNQGCHGGINWKDNGSVLFTHYGAYIIKHSTFIIGDINGDRLNDIISCGKNKFIAINNLDHFEFKNHDYQCNQFSIGRDVNKDGLIDIVNSHGVLVNNGGLKFTQEAYPEYDDVSKFLSIQQAVAGVDSEERWKSADKKNYFLYLLKNYLFDEDNDGVPEVVKKADVISTYATYARDMLLLKFKSGSSDYEIINNDDHHRMVKLSTWSGSIKDISYQKNSNLVVVSKVESSDGINKTTEDLEFLYPILSISLFQNLGFKFIKKVRKGVTNVEDLEKFLVFKSDTSNESPVMRVPYYGMPLFEISCRVGQCVKLDEFIKNPVGLTLPIKESDKIKKSTYSIYDKPALGDDFLDNQYYNILKSSSTLIKKKTSTGKIAHLSFRHAYEMDEFSLKGPMVRKDIKSEGLNLKDIIGNELPTNRIEEISFYQLFNNSLVVEKYIKKYFSGDKIPDQTTSYEYSGDDEHLEIKIINKINESNNLESILKFDKFGRNLLTSKNSGERVNSQYVDQHELEIISDSGFGKTKTSYDKFGNTVKIVRSNVNDEVVRDVNMTYSIPGHIESIKLKNHEILVQILLKKFGFTMAIDNYINGVLIKRNERKFSTTGVLFEDKLIENDREEYVFKAELNSFGLTTKLFTPALVGKEKVTKILQYDYLGRLINQKSPLTGMLEQIEYNNGIKKYRNGNNVVITDLSASGVPFAIIDNGVNHQIGSTTDKKMIDFSINYNDNLQFKRNSQGSIISAQYSLGADGLMNTMYSASHTAKTKSEFGIFKMILNDQGLPGVRHSDNGWVFKYTYDELGRFSRKEDEEFFYHHVKFNDLDTIIDESFKVEYDKIALSYELDERDRISLIKNDLSDDIIKVNYQNSKIHSIKPYIKKIVFDDYGFLSQVHYENGQKVDYDFNESGHLLSVKSADFFEKYMYNNEEKIIQTDSNINIGKKNEIRTYSYLHGQLANKDPSYKKLKRNYVGNIMFPKTRKLDYRYVLTEQGIEKPISNVVDETDLYYEGFGSIIGAINYMDDTSAVFLRDDFHYVNKKWIKYFKAGGKIIGALELSKDKTAFYPIVTDVRDSIRLIYSGNKPVVIKNYNDWGVLNIEESLLSEMSELIKYDYAKLMRNTNDSKFLISKSRLYSPEQHEWTTFDPMVLKSPESLGYSSVKEMNGVSYALNDPVNFVDPSGQSAKSPWDFIPRHQVDAALSTIAKVWGTAYGVAVSPFLVAGVGAGVSASAPTIASYALAGTMEYNIAAISVGQFITKNPNFLSNTYEFTSNLIDGASHSAPNNLYGMTASGINYGYHRLIDSINSSSYSKNMEINYSSESQSFNDSFSNRWWNK